MADSTQPGESFPEDTKQLRRKQRKREYDHQRYLQIRDLVRQQRKAYREANREKIRENSRQRYWSNPEKYRLLNQQSAKRNRAKNTAREKAWRKNNKDKVRGYYRKHVTKRRKTDIAFWLQMVVRTRIHGALFRASKAKQGRTLKLVGCTAAELKAWIEKQFLDGMTWKNHGRHGWHIDHVIPLAKFNLADPSQQTAAFHYTNLQPLWAIDNMKKSDKVPGQNLFGFAYAAKIADAASAKPKRRRKHGRQHSSH